MDFHCFDGFFFFLAWFSLMILRAFVGIVCLMCYVFEIISFFSPLRARSAGLFFPIIVAK